MSNSAIHLICNAHIDPVWLWNWEEGLAETLSTFRIAAKFCEDQDDFIFCHNEALLYAWVEEYEPDLFRKIRRLVDQGKWKIIGGWYVQPDCNLPSGESLVRQILTGKSYFRNKFGVEPATAVNFDPFGHTRGLVEILAKSGYHSYLFCRPDNKHLKLPADDFLWVGFGGSTLMAHRSPEHYNSEKGKAGQKFDKWLAGPVSGEGLFLWGIGNHGGGPSRVDLQQLKIRIDNPDLTIRHSWPEAFFESLAPEKERLPKYSGDLNPWAVGCYTSMAKVKRMHRELEESYYLTEKMVSHATLTGLMKYPAAQLDEALRDLLFSEFHDILPGSAIPEVEAYALQRMSHGLEILSRLRAGAFFKLLLGQLPAAKDEFPILIYNAEPFDVEEIVTVELQGPEPNFNPDTFLLPELYDAAGEKLEYQLEKESANIANDHRKRLVFKTKLKASAMNRFSCYLREVPLEEKPMSPVQEDLLFINDDMEIRINPDTGLIDQYIVGGFDYLRPDSAELLIMKDTADPWGMKVNGFYDQDSRFRLMVPAETARFAGTDGPVHPVRIIEEGPVRTVVEAFFRMNGSSAVVRYFIPKKGSEIGMEFRIFWLEKDRMLKLRMPTNLQDSRCLGEVAYGVQEFGRQGEELVAQQWIGLFSAESDRAFTIANRTTYGFDHIDGELRLSLLRSPAYAGHPVDDLTPIVRQDRFTPRMDQGEHLFRFVFNAGPAADRLRQVERESRLLNGGSMALCCFPRRKGKLPLSAVKITDPAIRMAALKFSESGKSLIIRLFETTGNPVRTRLEVPVLGVDTDLVFSTFEIKTISVDLDSRSLSEVNLIEL